MRTLVYNALEKLHGKFSFENQGIFKRDMKRMDLLYKKDQAKFKIELEKLIK